MIIELSSKNLDQIKNPDFQKYARIYTGIYDDYLEQIKSMGVELDKEITTTDLASKLKELKEGGALFRNEDKSIYLNWISPACEACRKGQGSMTFYLSLMCHRNCYYCFNPNQEDYEYYRTKKRDCIAELEAIYKSGQKVNHIALTGGEPLLHKKEMLEFFDFAHGKFGRTYLRLYTSGDLLDAEILRQLRENGLNEIRFSVKLEDEPREREHVLNKIALAKEYIQHVMVEMPVIPGTLTEMKDLLLKLDEIGVSGINLLEFCFPFNNLSEFQERSFKIKNPPFKTLYNYWYAGGLPVSGSEEECLELMSFALEKKMKIGVHYCSLENKHTGQVFQQNSEHKDWKNVYFSQKDYFLKTAKVFGEDISKVQKVFKKKGIDGTLDKKNNYFEFNLKHIEILKGIAMEIGISSNIIEIREDGKYLRELKIDLVQNDMFNFKDI